MENVSIVIILEDANAIGHQQKRSLRLLGRGGYPTHASADTSSAKYITPNEDGLDVLGLNLLRQCYWERNNKNIFCRRLEKKIPRVKHLFSLDLNSQTCPVSDVMSAEIHINGIDTAYSVGECTFAEATINGNCLTITHHFELEHTWHDTIYWGWEEKFSLEVSCSSLPEDVVEVAEDMIDDWKGITAWDGHHLYKLLAKRGVPSVDFKCIHFEEVSMRRMIQSICWHEMR